MPVIYPTMAELMAKKLNNPDAPIDLLKRALSLATTPANTGAQLDGKKKKKKKPQINQNRNLQECNEFVNQKANNSVDSDAVETETTEAQSLTSQQVQEFDSRTVHVENLCPSTNVGSLRAYCQKYGDVEKISIWRKKGLSKSAYVRYKNVEDVEKVLAENGKIWNGRHLSIDNNCYGKLDCTTILCLNGLSQEIVNEDLWRVFQCCGKIKSVKLHKYKAAPKSGFGYVFFESSESVDKALEMGEVLLYNRPIKMSRAIVKRKKCLVENSSQQADEICASSSNVSLQVECATGQKRSFPDLLQAGESCEDGREPEIKKKRKDTDSGGDN